MRDMILSLWEMTGEEFYLGAPPQTPPFSHLPWARGLNVLSGEIFERAKVKCVAEGPRWALRSGKIFNRRTSGSYGRSDGPSFDEAVN